MASYNNTIITNAGEEIIAKVIAGEIPQLTFTSVKTSSNQYPAGTDFKALTDMDSIQQTIDISSVEVELKDSSVPDDQNKVLISAFLTNAGVSTGYLLYNIGIYANYPGNTPANVLFAITSTVSTDQTDYVESEESGASSLVINQRILIADITSVTITLSSAGSASLVDIKRLEGLIAQKAPINHASTATTYGPASGVNYGHTKFFAEAAGSSLIGTSLGIMALTGAVNFNTIIQGGTYILTGIGAATNAPPGTTGTAPGYLEVLPMNPTASGYPVFQKFHRQYFDDYGIDIYCRVLTSSSANTGWQRINGLADSSTKVYIDTSSSGARSITIPATDGIYTDTSIINRMFCIESSAVGAAGNHTFQINSTTQLPMYFPDPSGTGVIRAASAGWVNVGQMYLVYIDANGRAIVPFTQSSASIASGTTAGIIKNGIYTGTIPTSGWVTGSTGYSTNVVTGITGILSTSRPLVDLNFDPANITSGNAANYENQWSSILAVNSGAGQVTFTCLTTERPTIDLPFIIRWWE